MAEIRNEFDLGKEQGMFQANVLGSLRAIEERGERIEKRQESHDVRLQYLEKQDSKVKAYCTLIPVVVSLVASKILSLWK